MRRPAWTFIVRICYNDLFFILWHIPFHFWVIYTFCRLFMWDSCPLCKLKSLQDVYMKLYINILKSSSEHTECKQHISSFIFVAITPFKLTWAEGSGWAVVITCRSSSVHIFEQPPLKPLGQFSCGTENLFKWSWSVNQDGCHAHTW